MRFDIIGGVLLWISAFLYTARYIAAAIFMGPGLRNWGVRLFKSSYHYVGNGLTIWAIVALIAGLGIIIAGYTSSIRKQKTENSKQDASDSK